MALKSVSSSSSVGLVVTIMSLMFPFLALAHLDCPTFFYSFRNLWIFLVLSSLGSASRYIIEGEQFDPRDSRDFAVFFGRCPFPIAEELVYFFVERLAVREPVFPFRGRNEINVLIVELEVLFVPDCGFCFCPF